MFFSHSRRGIFLFCAFCVFSFVAAAEKSSDKFPDKWLTGTSRQQALQKPLGTVTWDHSPLRASVTELCHQQKIAILVDRRVNPDLIISKTFQNATLPGLLRESLGTLEDPIHAVTRPGELYELSQVENVLYIGPRDFTRKLQTLTAIQNEKIPEKAKKIWEKKSPLSWEELARPREILGKIASANQIKIENLKNVPHDLWPRNKLPEMTLTGQITLILGQFGLTYDFDPQDASGKTILVKPLNLSEITLRKKYPRKMVPMPSEQLMAAVKERFPEAKIREAGDALEVEAPVEVHEFLKTRKPTSGPPNVGNFVERPAASVNSQANAGVSLNQNQRFTMEIRGPFFTVLDGMRSKGLDIQYDAESLRAAGVEPLTPIYINVKEVSAAVLFRDVAKQGGCEVEIRGNTVRFFKN